MMAEFKDTVVHVPTAELVVKEPSYDGGYHFNGNAENFYLIGEAMGEAMLELIGDSSSATVPEERKFTSADGVRSFIATLTGYDAEKEIVIVRKKDGRTIKFKIEHLSEEDREYVLSTAPKLGR